MNRFHDARIVVFVFLVLFLGLMPTMSAQAQNDSGPYLGLGFALGFEQFDGTGGLDFDEGLGFSAWGGYRFIDFVAAELQIEYLDRFDTSIFGVNVDVQAFGVTINGKVYPLVRVLPELIQPFVVAGFGIGWVEIDAGFFGTEDETGLIGRFGGGLEVSATEHLVILARATYVVTADEIEDLDWVSVVLGLQYAF